MKNMSVEGWDEAEVRIPDSVIDTAILRRLLTLEARLHSGKNYEIIIDPESAHENGWFKCYWVAPTDDPMAILDTPQVAGLAAVFGDNARVAWRTDQNSNIGFEYRPQAVIAWAR